MARSVRDAAFDVFRRRGLTTMFANPGSTEVPFLAGLPDDLRFVLGLHEGTVVGMASGYAIGRGEPALVLLHTTAGLGTAVSGLATARVNRAPLVVVVGQQDRRHLAFEPFLAGRLAGLGGDYPVSVEQPAQAQDVPAAIERACHAAVTRRGPALVIVPMGDWEEPADEEREPAAASGTVLRASAAGPEAVDALVDFLAGARSPALVVGAGADDPETWAALVDLAERLVAPVFQEPFGARAGFPRITRSTRACSPPTGRGSGRRSRRTTPCSSSARPCSVRPVFVAGRLTEPGTRIAFVGDDPDEAHRSPAALTVLAPPAALCRDLAARIPAQNASPPAPRSRPTTPVPPGRGRRRGSGRDAGGEVATQRRGRRRRGGAAGLRCASSGSSPTNAMRVPGSVSRAATKRADGTRARRRRAPASCSAERLPEPRRVGGERARVERVILGGPEPRAPKGSWKAGATRRSARSTSAAHVSGSSAPAPTTRASERAPARKSTSASTASARQPTRGGARRGRCRLALLVRRLLPSRPWGRSRARGRVA